MERQRGIPNSTVFLEAMVGRPFSTIPLEPEEVHPDLWGESQILANRELQIDRSLQPTDLKICRLQVIGDGRASWTSQG